MHDVSNIAWQLGEIANVPLVQADPFLSAQVRPARGKRLGVAAENSDPQTEVMPFIQNFRQFKEPCAEEAGAPRDEEMLAAQRGQAFDPAL